MASTHPYRLLGLLLLLSNSKPESQARVIQNVPLNLHRQKSEEIVYVHFQTMLRSRRDISSREFHIVGVRRHSEKSNMMTLHLVKKEVTSSDFRFLLKNGTNVEVIQAVQDECHYSGILSSESGGKAAISICGNSGELNGIIMTSEGHWMIEPLPVPAHDFSGTKEIPHRIVRSTNSPTTSLVSDQLYVPRDELVAAAEQALNDAKEDEGNDRSKLNETTVDVMNATEQKTIPLASRLFELDKDTVMFEPLAKRRSHSKVGKSSMKARMTANSASGSRKVVELAIFTDPDFYDEMKVRYPKNTNEKIKNYILTLVHAVDLIYEQKSLGQDFVFKLVRLEIMKSWPSKIKKNGKSAKAFLTSFCGYAGNLNTKNLLWDHALLLTGSDLKEDGSSAVAGLAWAGTMCYRFFSCSVSEALHLGSVYVIAHELGHSMGMDHDGSGTCKACDANKFLMSPTTGTGKVTWSSCSSKNLRDFVLKGSAELRSTKSAVPPICLSKSSRESTEIDYKGALLPGQKFDVKKQCRLALGKKYSPHITKAPPFNAICSMLFCANSTHAVTTHAALEGTKCANGKICKAGACIKV